MIIPVDLDGMRHAADEDDGHGHHLQAAYLRAGADEIERLRAGFLRYAQARNECAPQLCLEPEGCSCRREMEIWLSQPLTAGSTSMADAHKPTENSHWIEPIRPAEAAGAAIDAAEGAHARSDNSRIEQAMASRLENAQRSFRQRAEDFVRYPDIWALGSLESAAKGLLAEWQASMKRRLDGEMTDLEWRATLR